MQQEQSLLLSTEACLFKGSGEAHLADGHMLGSV